MEKKYYLSVGAQFKNESMVLKEWLDHYIFHGVVHFYLINDGSQDDFLHVLEPYISLNKVTLCNNDIGRHPGRQSEAYTKFFTPYLKDTQWLAILDLDEFLYSPKNVSLPEIFKTLENIAIVEVNWICFGSNGHIKQPVSIVSGFTKRTPLDYKKSIKTPTGYQVCWNIGPKCIINTKYQLKNFDIHQSQTINGTRVNCSWLSNRENPLLIINHYLVMSREYWEKVKMVRGDADCWHADDARNWEYFDAWDVSIENDERLLEQNREILLL